MNNGRSFALLLVLFVGISSILAAQVSDVKPDHWARKEVQELVDKGIVKLFPNGTFKGNKPLSRYDMAVIISRTLEEIDQNETGGATQKEVELLKQTLKMITDEIVTIKNDAAKQSDDHEAIMAHQKVLEEQVKVLGENVHQLESTTPKVGIQMEFRFRFENTRLETPSGKGSTTVNQDRVRVAFKANLDPTTLVYTRFKMTQSPTGRRAEKNTNAEIDQLYVEKINLLGADWRLGRQFYKHATGMVFMNYWDGLLMTKYFNPTWKFTGMIMAENWAEKGTDSNTLYKTHGYNANMVSIDYMPTDKYTLSLSSWVNNVEIDKKGVFNANGPQTKEGWISVDVAGDPHDRLKFYGAAAAYRNQLDGSNTKPTEQHLRGDIENMSYMFGVDYNLRKRLKLGAVWALQEDNYRGFSVLTDRYYGQSPNYHPLEDSINALYLAANLPGVAAEGIYPKNNTAAAPHATPLGKLYDNRPTGSQISDIHGYKDLQVTSHYWFTRRLSLRLSGAWMTPAKSKYNYADITSYMARLNFHYDARTNIELRGMTVDSDYGRKMTDFRTEVIIKF